MNDKLETIISILPKIEKVPVRCEADYYGMSSLVARKNKIPYIPMSFSAWKHGVYLYEVKYVEQLIGGEDSCLVLTHEHESFLKNNGVSSKAIGAPFIYVEELETQKIERYKSSLLVMPPHSLPYTSHDWDEELYAAKINDLKNKFDLIVVCVHQSCIDKGMWVNAFKKYDISYIIGADARDKNSLVRMFRIFNSFEYMTTNAFGSHIAYAAYSGCKVSIYGPIAEYTKEDYRDDPFYKRYPFVLEHAIKEAASKALKNKLSFLFTSPELASIRVEWASELLGRSNKVSFNELPKLLGWSPHRQIMFYMRKICSKIKKNCFFKLFGH